MYVSDPFSTLKLEPKTLVNLEESGGCIEAIDFPSISESVDSLLLSVQEDLKATAKQRDVQQLEVGMIPPLSEPEIVFREIFHLPTCSTGSRGPNHS